MEMRRNLKWLIAAIAAGLLVMAIAIPALAAGPNGVNGTPTPTTHRVTAMATAVV